MRVWVVRHLDYDEIDIWSLDVDPLDIPMVQAELEPLKGTSYQDEVDEFISDLNLIKRHGRGTAIIEERIEVTQEKVLTLGN